METKTIQTEGTKMNSQENSEGDLLVENTFIQREINRTNKEAWFFGRVLIGAMVGATFVPAVICWTANTQTAVHLVNCFRAITSHF
ncbi:MAG: hypothetical protein AAB470_00985 [Patescibacteria group bacterium]